MISPAAGSADPLAKTLVIERPQGAIARPDRLIFSADLPKTRSGKIMRRLLRDIAQGKTLGDTTTLTDAGVLDQLKARYAEDAE